MPTLNDIFRKFGEASEAAQLLETELGTIQLFLRAAHDGLIDQDLNVDSEKASELLYKINKQTLGQHINQSKQHSSAFDDLEFLLSEALKARNQLTHHFYRKHNFRKFSEEGREIMMKDLEKLHSKLLDAYLAVSQLTRIYMDVTLNEASQGDDSKQKSFEDHSRLNHFPM